MPLIYICLLNLILFPKLTSVWDLLGALYEQYTFNNLSRFLSAHSVLFGLDQHSRTDLSSYKWNGYTVHCFSKTFKADNLKNDNLSKSVQWWVTLITFSVNGFVIAFSKLIFFPLELAASGKPAVKTSVKWNRYPVAT